MACRKAICSADVTFFHFFFLTVSFETNYLRMYWIDLHQTFHTWCSFSHNRKPAMPIPWSYPLKWTTDRKQHSVTVSPLSLLWRPLCRSTVYAVATRLRLAGYTLSFATHL